MCYAVLARRQAVDATWDQAVVAWEKAAAAAARQR
jgi:hypothetical protein